MIGDLVAKESLVAGVEAADRRGQPDPRIGTPRATRSSGRRSAYSAEALAPPGLQQSAEARGQIRSSTAE